MYRRCIFCSSDLGSNDVLEEFPVGRQLAFDAWKGRLWVVCQGCSRWNLAPIEERWEPVEACEKLFRDARLRAQSENIGMARLADGTRLVRIQHREQMKIVHRIPARGVTIRRWHVPGINVTATDLTGADDGVALTIRDAHLKEPKWSRGSVRRYSRDVVTLTGDDALSALRRTMLLVNRKGASGKRLDDAHAVLELAGSADALVRRAGSLGIGLGKRAGDAHTVLKGADALAFEMALNEASERRALEGELIVLERAWQEAEEIAAIADALPFEKQIRQLLGY